MNSKTRILLLGQLTGPYTKGLRINLHNKGISTDIIDVFNNLQWCGTDTMPRKLFYLPEWFVRSRFFGTSLKIIFLKALLLRKRSTYSIINIHFFHVFYSRYLYRDFRNSKIPLVISVWGSDHLRRSERDRSIQRRLYDHATAITTNSLSIKDQLSRLSPSIAKKITMIQFGLEALNFIDRVTESDMKMFRDQCGIPPDALTITCGYNGRKEQQHSEVIQSITSSISPVDRSRVFLIFPMTYNTQKKYLEDIRTQLNESNISFLIIENYLSMADLATLRVISDIFVHVQTTDSQSGSVVESLYSGSLLINGRWNEYRLLENAGIQFITVERVGDVGAEIGKYLENDSETRGTEDYRDTIRRLFSWNSVINDWIELYGSMNFA